MLSDVKLQQLAEVPDQGPVWRPWSWWGTFGWIWLVGPTAVALAFVYIGGAATGDGTSGVSYEFGVASAILWLWIVLALLVRAVARRFVEAGKVQRRLGSERWRSRQWPRRWVTLWAFRIELLAQVCLVLFLMGGWSALSDQRVRHSPHAEQILATVTHADRHCDKSSCSYDSYGDYFLDGRQQSDVMVVNSSDTAVRGLVPIIVDPAHPRHAVYLHDHGWSDLIVGSVALLVLVVGNPIYFWTQRDTLRRRRQTALGRHAQVTLT
ncbi:hypothetical protein SAMN05444157_2502 [Frankineae bacterium MT45]|nr:hypothetical protein SAMN05444157_2502 [Frankineae bacterium MT45]